MKKTFFLLAFILPVCSVLAQPAQPQPFTPGTGDDNIATILTDGNDNVAKATQNGHDNESFIRQTNNGNKAIVNQTNHKTNEVNYIYSKVKQTGKNNKAFVTQEHNGGPSPRVLGLMEAYIYQTGDDNKATQVQGPGNKTGNLAVAKIRQTGDDNVASQHQGGYENTLIIKQHGNKGVARQSQDNGVQGSLAIINQVELEKENKAFQTQTNGSSLVALAQQTGEGNKATQNQTGWVNLAKSKQSGDDNVSKQDQAGLLNLATIKQRSNENTAKQDQSNVGGDRLPGYTAANVARILQEGGKGNVAHQTQTVVSVNDPDFKGNWGSIYQNGKENKAYQTQDGGFNIGVVVQNGNGNVANVTQNQSVIQP